MIAGDDDAIRLDHTCALYEALPAGELAIVPGASHLLPIEKPLDTARLDPRLLAESGASRHVHADPERPRVCAEL